MNNDNTPTTFAPLVARFEEALALFHRAFDAHSQFEGRWLSARETPGPETDEAWKLSEQSLAVQNEAHEVVDSIAFEILRMPASGSADLAIKHDILKRWTCPEWWKESSYTQENDYEMAVRDVLDEAVAMVAARDNMSDDATLLTLGEALREAWAEEQALDARPAGSVTGAKRAAAYDRSAALVRQIEAIQAVTVAGLKTKLFAIAWTRQGEKFGPEFLIDGRDGTTDLRLVGGLLRDLATIGRGT